MKAYRIRNWKQRFKSHVNSEGSPVEGDVKDFGLNKEAHAHLSKSKDGIVAMAVWVVLLRLAAKMPEPGLLVDESGPLTINELSKRTKLPASLFRRGLQLLMHRNVNWVELVECDKSLLGDEYNLDLFLKDPSVLAPDFGNASTNLLDDFLPKLDVPSHEISFDGLLQGYFHRHSVHWEGDGLLESLSTLDESNDDDFDVVDHSVDRPWGSKALRVPMIYLAEGESLKRVEEIRKRLGKEPELN